MTKSLVKRSLPGITPDQLTAAAGVAKRTTATMAQEQRVLAGVDSPGTSRRPLPLAEAAPMDGSHFDALARSLVTARSRRDITRLLGAPALASALALFAWRTARAKHTPGNCLHNGERCTVGPECCSGRCKRKPGTNKRFCRAAPGQGICTIESDTCRGDSSTACNVAGTAPCFCYVSSRGFSVCSQAPVSCFKCTSDAECVDRPGDGQAGDRCVRCASCPLDTYNARACARKCSNPATAPVP